MWVYPWQKYFSFLFLFLPLLLTRPVSYLSLFWSLHSINTIPWPHWTAGNISPSSSISSHIWFLSTSSLTDWQLLEPMHHQDHPFILQTHTFPLSIADLLFLFKFCLSHIILRMILPPLVIVMWASLHCTISPWDYGLGSLIYLLFLSLISHIGTLPTLQDQHQAWENRSWIDGWEDQAESWPKWHAKCVHAWISVQHILTGLHV